ncbi:sugar transferase [Falsarthrobacter nasiphocae]|uniref:Exopolysaccharide biosynthesis polyprenyl glycosylphosphotransferase n=1 Tax=Falsarthrobacter nasiphocae TaxID=189863 RepID=A0AAE3YFN2_9MICC|nr:sugar transferase [Falsarthrobacter nasiphocae]MDR6892559.1 exopolysaccharide biosynthesis polyprenyl glycosylphosphotransferase [Falsarthrobacter nasiphocae]
MLSDAIMVFLALTTANIWRFGLTREQLHVDETATSYWSVTAIIAVVWWVFLGLWGSRSPGILGQGFEEYKRTVSATLSLFGAIAILSYLSRVDTSRGYVAIALPAGLLLLLLSRAFWRRRLIQARLAGHWNYRVMLLGSPSSVLHLHSSLSAHPQAGYDPIVAYLPGFSRTAPNGDELPLPVAGTSLQVDGILAAIEDYRLDAVAISSSASLSPRAIRRLGWELADRHIRLIMAPALTDVAGPRIHTQPIAGLPLIHVSTPRLSGINAFLKRSFDVVLASLAAILLSPVLIATALAVKLDSPGPVVFNQERVGKNGKRFQMHKFRSMVTDAETKVSALAPETDAGNEVLFKIKDDPRITRVGRFIRRYSIDELPQILNVLKGEMSLVGPRPPLPREVAKYEDHVHRRLLVQPGITGLWQVSGRSDLSWNDTVRLDLYYVENWSLAQDVLIIFKTFRAVVASKGAY